jgi:hypothetical protein
MASKKKRTFTQTLLAQWPGALGLGMIGFAVFMAWQSQQGLRGVAWMIGVGICLLAYWAFANNNSDYKF